MPPSISIKKSTSAELWRDAYLAIQDDPDQCRVLDKFAKAISKDKKDTPDLSSDSGRKQLLKMIEELNARMQSSQSPKVAEALEKFNVIRSIIATGASANPFATIPVAGFFLAFDLIQNQHAEAEDISNIVLRISSIMYRNPIRDHLVETQPDDHPALLTARSGLRGAFVQLNRIILLLSMKIAYKLQAWHKYFLAMGAWRSKLEELKDAEERVKDYTTDINFCMLNSPKQSPNWKKTDKQSTRLHRLVQDGRADLIYNMIEAGQCTPDVLNAKTSKGWTALMFAARDGKWVIMNYLLRLNDVLVNAKNCDGNTALILAATNNRPGHVKKLVEKGAKLNIRNNGKRTAWLEAAIKGKIKAMKALLEKGDNINQVTGKNGWCALHTAVEKDNIDLAKWLLEKGAKTDIAIKSGGSKGLTPRGLAEKMKREEFLKILPQAIQTSNYALTHANLVQHQAGPASNYARTHTNLVDEQAVQTSSYARPYTDLIDEQAFLTQ